MKNEKSLPAGRQGFINILIIGIVVIAVAGIVGYVAIQETKESIETDATEDIEEVVDIDIIPEDTVSKKDSATVGWKTYRNGKYGFEFKYPNEIAFSSPVSTSRNAFTIDSWRNQKSDKNEPAVGLFISLLNNSGEQMLKESKDLWSKQADKLLEIQEIKIGENPGLIIKNVRATVSDTSGDVARTASVLLSTFKDKYFYSFQCSQDGNNWDKCNQILSTFKFISQ